MSLNGGFIYTAGKCGLVPVLGENYSKWMEVSLAVLFPLGHELRNEEII